MRIQINKLKAPRMNTDHRKIEYKRSLRKFKAIISSCENHEQIRIARNYQVLFAKHWYLHITIDEINEIENLFMVTKEFVDSNR